MRIPDKTMRKAFIQKLQKAMEPLKPGAIYLFGTYGTEYERKDSDVDIAFLSAHTAESELVSQATDALSDILHRDVDLIDLQNAPTSFRHVIVEEGECLVCSNSLLREEFEMYTLSDYARLNEERKPILESLQRELA